MPFMIMHSVVCVLSLETEAGSWKMEVKDLARSGN